MKSMKQERKWMNYFPCLDPKFLEQEFFLNMGGLTQSMSINGMILE